MSEHIWHYYSKGLFGEVLEDPVTEAKIFALARRGEITANTKIASPTRTKGQWVLAGQVSALVKAIEDGEEERAAQIQKRQADKIERKRQRFHAKRLPKEKKIAESPDHGGEDAGLKANGNRSHAKLWLGFLVIVAVFAVVAVVGYLVTSSPTKETAQKDDRQAASIEPITPRSSNDSGDKAQSVEKERSPARKTAQEIYSENAQAVVSITVFNEANLPTGTGSGVFVPIEFLEQYADQHLVPIARGYSEFASKQFGFVLTNHHVIRGAVSATCNSSDNYQWDVGSVPFEDETKDLALLSVYSKRSPPASSFRIAANISKLKVGDRVFAIGNPMGLDRSLSEGIVSGIRNRGIQITAPISPGSSGGPLFNEFGELIGVTTASVVEAQNLNVAVPSSEIVKLVSRERRSRQLWEGVSVRHERSNLSVSEIAGQIAFAKISGGHEGQADLATLEPIQEWLFNPQAPGALEKLLQAEKDASGSQHHYLLCFAIAQEFDRLAGGYGPGMIIEIQKQMRESPNYDQSVNFYNKSIQLRDDYLPAYADLVQLLHRGGQCAQAVDVGTKMIAVAPYCPDAYLLRAKSYSLLSAIQRLQPSPQQGAQTDPQHLADVKKCLDLDPKNKHGLIELAGAYQYRGEFLRTALTYQRVLDLGIELQAPHLLNMGLAFQAAGEFNKAIEAFEACIKENFAVEGCKIQIEKCRRGIRR